METRLGVPTFLWTRTDFTINQNSALTPEGIAREYLAIYAPFYNYREEHLNSAKLRYIHDTGRGAIIAKFTQLVNGYEVYGTEMNVAMDRNLQVHGLTGYLFPHEINNAVLNFNLNPEQAIVRAFADLEGETIATGDLEVVQERDGYEYYSFKAGLREGRRDMIIPTRIKRMLYGTPQRFVPVYFLELNTGSKTSTDSDYYNYIISAEDGSLLQRQNLTVSDSYTYRAWANDTGNFVPWDGPQGNAGSPHPTGTPNGHQEANGQGQLITVENVPGTVGSDPWLPPASTETVGNNVDAYIDRFGGDGYQPGSGDFRATTSSASTFDYPFDHNSSPTGIMDSQMAATVQLFVVNNYLHDIYYRSGFDEAAGNAQEDNYGRGGSQGDPIHAEAQNSPGTNNANMSTPADGGSPRMQMFVFTGPTPDRDGTIDNGISGHEWGHYIHRRMIAGGNTQMSAMSEGWGDIIATIMAVEEGDDYEGAYTTGAYATFHFIVNTSYEDNFYFGIRRYPYSTDFTKNALTFQNIGGPTSNLPAGVPISPLNWQNNGNAEVHNAGEIWATMFWECYHDLIIDRTTVRGSSFQEAKAQMQDYLVASMKLSPASTTYTEARDALMLAASANMMAPQDFNIFGAAFARRGIGQGAVSPDRGSSSLDGVVESFEPILGHALSFGSASLDDSIDNCDNDGVLDEGETGLLTINLDNTGFLALSATSATVSSSDDVTFSNGGAIAFPGSQAGNSTSGTVEVTLNDVPVSGDLSLTITYTDADPDVDPQMETIMIPVHLDLIPTTTDDVEAGLNTWQRQVDQGTILWDIADDDGTFPSPTHAWFVPDDAATLDSSLVTPPMVVPGAGDFTFSFKHKHSFETAAGPQFWDGGVLEITTNGGTSWTDIGASATPTYGGTIEVNAESPISGQPAFVSTNTSFPNFDTINVNLGSTYAGMTVQVRWRVGCDGLMGDLGWWVDDISFPTITPPPFNETTTEPDSCIQCFNSLAEAIQAMLDSSDAGNWPDVDNVLNYIDGINNICMQ